MHPGVFVTRLKALQRGVLWVWPRRPLAGRLGLLVLLLLAAPAVRAQVLDDSTKVLYGPKTTRLIYEAEVLRDSTAGTPLDTTLTRWPQARFWMHDTTFQQDLGAVGTASRPLLYRANTQLGARFGRTVFDKYARDASAVPYYDSRSPYSFFRWLQSGAGEQVFELSYSRSLKKDFSVGVAYERIASNKILAAQSSREGLVEHNNVLFFGRYQTEDERYHLLANFSTVRHRVAEQGGIRPLPGQTRPRDLFTYAQERVYLTLAANTEHRDELYFTQTYRLLGRGLTVYHTFDVKRQYNSYLDSKLVRLRQGGFRFYSRDTVGVVRPRATLRDTLFTLDRALYRQLENTVGVLGRTTAVEYRLYGRVRQASLRAQTLKPTRVNTGLDLEEAAGLRSLTQAFIGGTAAFNYRKIYAIETAGEYKFFDEYWLRGAIRTGPLAAEALISSYSPTLTQQEFVGNHFEWHHLPNTSGAFKNTTTSQLTARLRLPLSTENGHHLEASLSAVNINHLVYYDSLGRPAQLGEDQSLQLLIGFARHRIRLGRVYFDNQLTYTRGAGDDQTGLHIPRLVANSRVYLQGYIFRKALLSQVGAEIYYQSRFRAFDYSPSNQQFYEPTRTAIFKDGTPSYAVADVFFVADIKTVSAFLKVAYLNQGVFVDGYSPTPYYSGYPRRFQFGVRWDFFN